MTSVFIHACGCSHQARVHGQHGPSTCQDTHGVSWGQSAQPATECSTELCLIGNGHPLNSRVLNNPEVKERNSAICYCYQRVHIFRSPKLGVQLHASVPQ